MSLQKNNVRSFRISTRSAQCQSKIPLQKKFVVYDSQAKQYLSECTTRLDIYRIRDVFNVNIKMRSPKVWDRAAPKSGKGQT